MTLRNRAHRKLFASAFFLLGAATLLSGPPASAQTFPTKPIKLVVPFTPGTGSDLLARQITPRFSELLGQPVVIDNRAGAGGLVGAEFVAKSPSDGYTLLVGTVAQFVIAPAVGDSSLRFHPESDFATVGTLARAPMILVTSAGDGAPQDLNGLLQRIRSGPSNFSSTGTGGFGHLTGEIFSYRVGAKGAMHVPYKGSAQSLTDVASGQILYALDSPAAAISLIKAKKLRALAVTGSARMASLRDVPTLEESGVKKMDIYAWFGLFAPAGTPQAALARLRTDLATTVKDPGLLQRLSALELEPYESTPEALEEAIKRDIPFWKSFIRESGLKVNQ